MVIKIIGQWTVLSLVGWCTNSWYEDLSRCASIYKQVRDAGSKVVIPFFITPGSEKVRATINRDGVLFASR